MRLSCIGTCGVVLTMAACVNEPVGPSGPRLEHTAPLAAIVTGPVVTLKNISELQPLPGATDARPAAVNRLGQAVGSSGGRPVIWEGGVPTELPVPTGWEGVAPNSISDDGRIVGMVGRSRVAMWEDGALEEFAPFPGYPSNSASINSAGIVVGNSGSSEESVAFVWEDGVATVLPPAEGYDRASAAFANATGMVLGTSREIYSEEDPDEFANFTIWQDGVVIDVIEGRPAPPEERAAGISDAGDAYMDNTDGGWQIDRWRDGTVTEFPPGEASGEGRRVLSVTASGDLLLTWEGDLGVWVGDEFRPLDDGIVSTCGGLALDGWLVCQGPGRERPFVAQLELDTRSSPWVSDLAVRGITASSATLTWTQIDDGTGSPASYRLKYARPPIDWSTATIGCQRNMHGTEIGAPMSCTVDGLEAQTAYEFQLMSFHMGNGVEVDAQYSNRAATTTGSDRVTDLRQQSSNYTTMNMEWTQVDDGTGSPAWYRVKYSVPPISYSTATNACTIQGDEIGALLWCDIDGLDPGTYYDVQLMSYRFEHGRWVDAKKSNVVTARTSGASPSGVVNDLRVFANTYEGGTSTVRLQWTRVDDGNGNPASYQLRYGSPLERWEDGVLGCDRTGGTGNPVVCTISGLTPGVLYDFQLVSYGVDENGTWVNAQHSNMVSATTATE